MTEKTTEKLRALLKSYADRTAKAPADVKPALDAGEPRRRACRDRLQKVVRPALQAFAAELTQAGHQTALEDETESPDADPSVALSFTPRAPGRAALASVLTFRYDPRRGVAVSRDLKASPTRGRLVTSSTDRIGTMKVEAVTPDWVETKALSFVEAVLKAN